MIVLCDLFLGFIYCLYILNIIVILKKSYIKILYIENLIVCIVCIGKVFIGDLLFYMLIRISFKDFNVIVMR